MVTFEKISEDDRYISFLYYPENNRESVPGKIVVDKENEKIDIIEVAENDYERKTPVEELNVLINAINEMKSKNGEKNFIELATESEHSVWYGDHAVNEIYKYLQNGVVPEEGMQSWY